MGNSRSASFQTHQDGEWLRPVYLIAFGEGARHLHLHLIPRFQEDQRSAAWSVADLYRDVEAGRQRLVQTENVQEFLVTARLLAQNGFMSGPNKS